MKIFFLTLLWTATAFSHTQTCAFTTLSESIGEIDVTGIRDVAAFKKMAQQADQKLDRTATAAGWTRLEKNEVGAEVVVLDVTEPVDGKPGSIELHKGRVIVLASHFDESREPRHDTIVIRTESGKRFVMDSSDPGDRIYKTKADPIPMPPKEKPVVDEMKARGFPQATAENIWDLPGDPMDKLLRDRGWKPVTPENKDQLIGKEVIGYQTWTNPAKITVEGYITATVPFSRFDGQMGGLKTSPVTGDPPFIAVDVLPPGPGGSKFPHAISAPGKYYVRDPQ